MNKKPEKNGNGLLIFMVVIFLILLLSMCSNSGESSGRKTCAWCNGTGYSGNGATNAVEYVLNKTPCKHCNGKGYIG